MKHANFVDKIGLTFSRKWGLFCHSRFKQKSNRHMAKPQLENGYVKIANEILEAAVHCDLTASEYKIFLFIVRKTYGWRKQFDAIPLSQFQKACSLPRRTVTRSLKSLEDRRCIIRQTRKNSIWTFYAVQKDWELWKGVRKSVDNSVDNAEEVGTPVSLGRDASVPTTRDTSVPLKRQYKRQYSKERKKSDKGLSTIGEILGAKSMI